MEKFYTAAGRKSLYFNAWESDFVSDPLVALIGELQALFPPSSKKKSLLAAGGRIITKVGREIIKEAIKKTTGVDSDAISAGIDEAASLFVERISEYEKSKTEFQDFRNALIEFVASETTNNNPIVFFIDELDRCSPHYAVKVLERIKHLFEVPNIIFVISVNINQLQYAVQGFYGSANIDGREYLRRFIDLEYPLPEPDIENYVSVLFDTHNFDSFFNQGANQNGYYDRNRNNKESVKYLATELLSKSKLNLRIINKIMANFRLVLCNFTPNTTIPLDLVFFLCYIKILYPEIYNQIKHYEYTLQELLNVIENKLPSSLFITEDYNYTSQNMASVISSLLFAYNYKSRGIETDKTFKIENGIDDKDVKFQITPTHIDYEVLNNALISTYRYEIRSLMYGLQKIVDDIDFVNGLKYGWH